MTTAVTVIAPFYYPADTPLAVGATASLPDSLADQMVSAGKARYQTPRTSDRTDLTADEVSLIRGVVSEAGNITTAALATTTGTLGQTVRLADGENKGAILMWSTPAGSTTPTWCWWLWPQAAY